MKKIYVCGSNYDHTICEKSHNSRELCKNFIYPPIPLDVDVSKISSFSTFGHTVFVTTDGVAHGIGNNKRGQISVSHPKEILKQYTNIELKDSRGRQLFVISAVCGECYTLYLVSLAGQKDQKFLAYSYENLKASFPVILNIGEMNPVALFFCRNSCAAIDEEGGIIYVHKSIQKSPTTKLERVFLPFAEKAVSIAWSYECVISLGSSGQVFKSEDKKDLSFNEISELKGNEFVCISGIDIE